MGHLRNGVWFNDDVATSDEKGRFQREVSSFREMISTEHEVFQPEANRYHLYVSYACPWAHRTLIARKLKGLEKMISFSVVHPDMLEHSWTFSKDFEACTGDALNGKNYLYEVYQLHDPKVTTKVTVPVLWDKKTKTIVNNESSEILRIFNSAFQSLGASELDLCPANLRGKINEINERIYEPINNGVYKSGFAKSQSAYDKAVNELFSALDEMEKRLEKTSFLVGEEITEADIRFVTTLLRFDLVYYVHFKCNLRRIADYPTLSRYLRKLWDLDAVSSTTFFSHIKRHYYYSHEFINPYRIVPAGPDERTLI